MTTDPHTMMFARPHSCRYCGHGFYALLHVVQYAQQLNKWNIIDMQEAECNKDPIYVAINTYNPGSYYGFGHGNTNVYTGDAEEPIFTSTECSLLAGRVVYFLSCLTAVGLGPAIIANGGTAYAGFNISWTWMSGGGTEGDPYEDEYAHGFFESANELWIALLDGATLAEAAQASINKYNEWIDFWFYSNDSHAASAMQWLAWDRDGLVALGDLTARFFHCASWLTKDECLTHGCYWWNSACHDELPPDIQDTKNIIVLVPPSYAAIENKKQPDNIYPDFSYEISYDCRNTGEQNIVWGHIKDLDTGAIMPDSSWSKILMHDGVEHVTTLFPPTTKNMNLIVEVGHYGVPIICADYATQTDCIAHGCFWYNGSCHATAPTCEELTTSTECEAFGCYWYDGSCHSIPPPLYERYNIGDDTAYSVYTKYWLAQTFTVGNTGPNVDHYISKVKLLLYRAGNPGEITVRIRAVDSYGKPTGGDLSIGTTDGNTLPPDYQQEWREIYLTPYLLKAGVKYAIVVSAVASQVAWRADKSSPTYSGGSSAYSNNSGTSWTLTSADQLFEEY